MARVQIGQEVVKRLTDAGLIHENDMVRRLVIDMDFNCCAEVRVVTDKFVTPEMVDVMIEQFGGLIKDAVASAKDQPLALPTIEKVALKPGDMLVVHCDQVLNWDCRTKLALCVERMFPENKVLVLDRGMKLGVVSESVEG